MAENDNSPARRHHGRRLPQQSRFTSEVCRNARCESKNAFKIEYPAQLPISAKSSMLRQVWQENQVIIVSGATGSGKTTQLPKIAIENGCGISGRIGCTQPRRIAATAMARRLAQELGCEYGQGVGSQVRFEDKTSDGTVLKFMTDGILLAEFRDDPLLSQYDALIVDEAHERTLNIDFLLGLLKNILPKRRDLKLAISSATLDIEQLAGFFPDAPIIEVEGRTFPVEDIFLPPEYDEELPEHVARAVEYLAGFDPWGDILVFLPGEREIRDCLDMLNGRNYRNTEVLPLYARLSSAEQQRVFQHSRNRRIILSTNVAETSLTIPNISFCVDSGLARISRYNPRTGIQELHVEMISQASARQRRGRCGRTADGICVHLYSEDDLQRADAYTDPELKRSSLAGVILQMAALRLPEISRFPFIDPPKSQLIREGMRTLGDIQALDKYGRLTQEGRRLANIPLDPHLGKMLLSAFKLKVVPQLLVLAAGLSVGDVRERPAEKQQAADEAHARYKDEKSDFCSMLKLWNDLAGCDSTSVLRKFCQRNYLNFRRVREWRNLTADLASAVNYAGKVETLSLECYEQIHLAILSGIPRNIALYDNENRIYRGTDNRRFLIFPGSSLAKKRRPPEWIMTFHLVETTRVFGRTVAEIEPGYVERIAPHLCSRLYDQEHFDPASGFVRAREKLSCGGLIVHAGRKVDFGRCNSAAAREIFIREGVLEALVNLPGTVIESFNRAKNDLEKFELKMRRPGSLYDADSAERFFYNLIPADVNSVHTLKEYLIRRADRPVINREDLMLEQFVKFDFADYPDELSFSGMKFKLDYHFDPGSEADGITLLVPENAVNMLPDRALDYPVAGYYAEFAEALLRSLPKELRRKINGIGEAANGFKEYLKNDMSAKELPPGEALAEFLLYEYELEINPKLFLTDRVPEYLKLKLGILNKQGRLVSRSTELPERVNMTSRVSGSLPGAAKHMAVKLTEFPTDDGIIPESVEVPPKSGRISYPALVDDGESVSRQLFLKLPEARRRHRLGVLRLFMISHGAQAKFLKRNLRLSNEVQMSLVYGSDRNTFENELLLSALEAAAGCDLWQVRSAEKFAAVSAEMEMNWADEIDDLCAMLEKFSADCTAVRTAARKVKHGSEALLDQLEYLFAPGFMRRPALQEHYPRYLRALKLRAARFADNPGKDAAKGEILEPWLDRFYGALEKVNDVTDSDSLYEFWEMLEEAHIAVYAPEVKTAVKAPVNRLAGLWDSVIL